MRIELTLAWRYLWGRRLRAGLTTLAVVMGVLTLFGMGSLMPTLAQALRLNMLAASGEVDLTVTHVSGGTFDEGRISAVRSVSGILVASPSLRRSITLPSATGQAVNPKLTVSAVDLVGLAPDTAEAVRAYPLTAGRFLSAGDQNAMVLPESLARKLELGVGDRWALPSATGSTTFEIVGIVVTHPTPGVEEAYVPLSAAQALLAQLGRINTIEALFTAGAEKAEVERAVQAVMGPDYHLKPLETGTELAAGLAMGQNFVGVVGFLALVMGGFIIFNTFRTIVTERRRDLGMLRAVGATRGHILRLILFEALIQGCVGSAAGIVLGYLFATALVAALNPVMQAFIHLTVGAPVVSAGLVIGSLALGLGMTLLGGLWPALSAMRVAPLDALRPAVAAVEKRNDRARGIIGALLVLLAAAGLVSGRVAWAAPGAFLFLVGLVLLAPILVRPLAELFGRLLELMSVRESHLARGNLARQPGRAAVTASTVMISLAIIVTVGGLLSSVFLGMDVLIERSLGADMLVMPTSLMLGTGNIGAAPALAEQMRAVPGVATLTTVRMGITQVDGQGLQLIGVDPVIFPQIAGLEFTAGDAARAFADLGRERALIVNSIFAMQAGVRVGDALMLSTPAGPQSYRIVAVGIDFLNAKLQTAYLSQANLQSDFGINSDVMLMADLAPGADVARVRAELERLVEPYPTFTVVDSGQFRETLQETIGRTGSLGYIMMLAFTLPALLALVNTLAINVVERTREIGVLRAVGSTRQQIGRMIRAESLLLAALGTVFGILAGLWLGYVLVNGLRGVFPLPYVFPYAGMLVAVAAGLLLGVIAASLPARQAARLDIVNALHYE